MHSNTNGIQTFFVLKKNDIFWYVSIKLRKLKIQYFFMKMNSIFVRSPNVKHHDNLSREKQLE